MKKEEEEEEEVMFKGSKGILGPKSIKTLCR